MTLILSEPSKSKSGPFINDSYSEDGSWINGDWVPWKYQLNFMTSDSGKDDKTHIIRFSEREQHLVCRMFQNADSF